MYSARSSLKSTRTGRPSAYQEWTMKDLCKFTPTSSTLIWVLFLYQLRPMAKSSNNSNKPLKKYTQK